jgi:regulator of nucleoside diphosphate kinase
MKLPPITIAKAERDRLVSIATAALGSERPNVAASMLLSEVSRATIVAQGSLPPQVVAVHSEVDIHDKITNTKRRLRLVYPEEATADSNAVSVLTPLGAALIGLSVGDSIDWCTATGDQRFITVLRTDMKLSHKCGAC